MLIVIVVLVIIGLYLMSVYNQLVSLKEKVNVNWSQVDVVLKQRADLIPNLVETVKGYAKHEKETFKMVTEARSAAMGAKTVKQAAEAERTWCICKWYQDGCDAFRCNYLDSVSGARCGSRITAADKIKFRMYAASISLGICSIYCSS